MLNLLSQQMKALVSRSITGHAFAVLLIHTGLHEANKWDCGWGRAHGACAWECPRGTQAAAGGEASREGPKLPQGARHPARDASCRRGRSTPPGPGAAAAGKAPRQGPELPQRGKHPARGQSCRGQGTLTETEAIAGRGTSTDRSPCVGISQTLMYCGLA